MTQRQFLTSPFCHHGSLKPSEMQTDSVKQCIGRMTMNMERSALLYLNLRSRNILNTVFRTLRLINSEYAQIWTWERHASFPVYIKSKLGWKCACSYTFPQHTLPSCLLPRVKLNTSHSNTSIKFFFFFTISSTNSLKSHFGETMAEKAKRETF